MAEIRSTALRDIETANISGSLMNPGKITVPSELLTKRRKLTDEEFRTIRESVLVSARPVESLDFEGPVYPTLRQLQEHVDGSGMPFDKAIDILLQDAGKNFDRRVVVALASHLDNRGGREEWAGYGERPESE